MQPRTRSRFVNFICNHRYVTRRIKNLFRCDPSVAKAPKTVNTHQALAPVVKHNSPVAAPVAAPVGKPISRRQSVSATPLVKKIRQTRRDNPSRDAIEEIDEFDTEVAKNASILFINNKNQVLLVRIKSSKLWSLPGGKKDADETDFDAASREFTEETTFDIVDRDIYKKRAFFYGKNSKHTMVYVCNTNQIFDLVEYDPKQVKDNETDSINYINMHDLRDVVYNRTQSFKLRPCVRDSLYCIFEYTDALQ